jgi:hypothetical protein
MGWVFSQYDDDLRQFGAGMATSDSAEYFPGLSVAYMRLAWSFIEPKEGEFQWWILDTPSQRWIDSGRRIALRFTSTESSWPSPPYATPRWVRAAGAKGHNFVAGEGVSESGEFWEPDYNDPIYLAKLDHFIAAAAAKYDGDSNVAFVDVGSFGVWGEGHTTWSTKIPYSADTIKRIIDIYRAHFKRTLLVVNDDFTSQDRGIASIDYAQSLGLTLRDDSILVHSGDQAYLSAKMADRFWQSRPVILETQYYRVAKRQGTWNEQTLLRAMEDYHASYLGFQDSASAFLAANTDVIRRINLRLGYRLNLLDASWPDVIPVNSTAMFAYTWQNAGVAPVLSDAFPSVTLKDPKGGIAAVFVDGAHSARELLVGAVGSMHPGSGKLTMSFLFEPPMNNRSILAPGRYDLFFSVGSPSGTPAIALPLPGSDGQHRYRLGRITILPVSGRFVLDSP